MTRPHPPSFRPKRKRRAVISACCHRADRALLGYAFAMVSSKPLSLAVVGHTNVGKTSLMRTLMRDSGFGQVAPTAATTRRVECARLLVEGQPVVELSDTPGLEDASALIDQLESDTSSARHDGPEQIHAFVEHAPGRFEQEARVLDQMMASDAALYVIDAREPVLGKYQDELAILARCARPILPVLNFTAGPAARVEQWRAALARVNLHAVAEFDTVVFSLEAETRLWRSLATLLDAHAAELERLVEDRRDQAEWQRAAALRAIAEMLVDVAAARRHAARDDESARDAALAGLKADIEARERGFVEELLELYRFAPDDHRYLPLPTASGAWQRGLFAADMLERVGRNAGRGLAAGAAAGAAVDVATGGLSLGAGTLIGSLVGSGGGALWELRDTLGDRLRGRVAVAVDDRVLGWLAARATALADALAQRGHAACRPGEWADNPNPPWSGSRLPKPLRQARLRPRVSRLNADPPDDPDGRGELAGQLAARFAEAPRQPDPGGQSIQPGT